MCVKNSLSSGERFNHSRVQKDLKSHVFSTTENYAQQAENNTGFFDFLRGITPIGNKIAYVYTYTYTIEQAYVDFAYIV